MIGWVININDIADKFLKGKNAKYLIFLCIGIMVLIASSSFTDDTKSSKGFDSQLEKRLTQILNEIDGVENASVMISCKNNEAEGVIIVAQGVENPAIKNKVHSAAVAALGVQSHKVEVFSKKGGEVK